MLDPDVLALLRCPITHSPLSLANAQTLGQLNKLIEQRRLISRLHQAIEISLDEPLARGQYACVVITTAEGNRTGHTLRAFPSKFNILVAHARTPRLDFMEDIYYHGALVSSKSREAESETARGSHEQSPSRHR